LAAVGAILARPVILIVRFLHRQPAISSRRLAVVAAAALGCMALVFFLLTRPSTIRAWGIVEYSPPTIVRSGSPGFVREVKVRDGETVRCGQEIAVLENEELRLELADLQAQIDQSRIRERMLRQNEENAKAQAEVAKCQSLQKKEAEVRKLAEGLTIRAPLGGRIVARDLASLPGRYLSVGDEVVVIGNPESKEIILAVAQDDIRSFLAQRDRPVTVRIAGDESRPLTACLSKIEPRASQKMPHPALGADAGGDLPVKAKRESPSSKNVESELLDPCFTGTIPLTPAQSLQLYSGQRAMIVFGSAEQSRAGRLVMKVRQWIDDRLASVHHNQGG
jgi:putative peptide zinc metalloprotease protein